jgi:hypothetical protein
MPSVYEGPSPGHPNRKPCTYFNKHRRPTIPFLPVSNGPRSFFLRYANLLSIKLTRKCSSSAENNKYRFTDLSPRFRIIIRGHLTIIEDISSDDIHLLPSSVILDIRFDSVSAINKRTFIISVPKITIIDLPCDFKDGLLSNESPKGPLQSLLHKIYSIADCSTPRNVWIPLTPLLHRNLILALWNLNQLHQRCNGLG